MSGGKNQRALLMELLVVVLFFSLCATVLLQTFMAARETSRQAGLRSDALTELQVLSERLYAAEDVEALLTEAGFAAFEQSSPFTGSSGEFSSELAQDSWIRQSEGYTLFARPSQQQTEAGNLREVLLTAAMQDEVLAQWRCTRYLPGEVSE